MKHTLVMAAAFMALSGCILVPAHPHGPGNSDGAPGQNRACGEGPGNSGSAPGQVKKNCY
ncbi:MAG TPA: hypothetical protein VIO56_05670 [Methylotenera sp.]